MGQDYYIIGSIWTYEHSECWKKIFLITN